MKKFIIALTIAAFAAISTSTATAADAKPAAEPKATPGRAIPFNGKIALMDKQAKTVKVGERVFQVTSTTRITKDNKPATLDDAKVGEEVGGPIAKGTTRN